jgi:ribosomal protein L37AE/L43A
MGEKIMPRKPPSQLPIKTDVLPAICPACAASDISRVDSFGIWRVSCGCGWSEKYQVQERA